MASNSFSAFPIKPGGTGPSTSTGSSPTKADQGNNLAGKQVVPHSMTDYNKHLPYSPASGAPTQVSFFDAGHRWTEADGKVHPSAGNGAV